MQNPVQNSAVEIQSLDTALSAETLFSMVSDLPFPVWLDSSDSNIEGGRYHLISAVPEEQIQASQASKEEADTFFAKAQSLLDQYPARNAMPGVPFQGGLVGYISYELGAASLSVESKNRNSGSQGFMGLYLWALIIDKLNQSQQLIFHPDCNPTTKQEVVARYTAESQEDVVNRRFHIQKPFSPSIGKSDYLRDLAEINDYVHAGDVYQVNYAQHFRAPYQGNTLDAYRRLRQFAPAPYSGYFQLDDKAILCHSPEQFLEVKGRHVRSSPIKGTAPRSANQRLDQRNAEVLQASEKDRAENLMIVDLMRNDLGKLCVSGSVQASKLFELKSYSNVHHLVSEIVGELEPGRSGLDLLKEAIPAGSITGAPKKRSVEIIQKLEAQPRSFYCGNLGYISLCSNMDFNIGIRSLIADGQEMHCWGGGGIVADSNPEKEYEETLHKVGGLMTELEEHFLNAENSESNQTSA